MDGVAAANTPRSTAARVYPATRPYVIVNQFAVERGAAIHAASNYDTYHALPVPPANAFGQSSTTTLDYTQAALPTLLVDANGQQTSTSYSIDSSGNQTVQTQLPLYSGSYTGKSITNSSCVGSSVLPCYEVDTLSNQYSTVTARTFYDSQGRAVETRTPRPHERLRYGCLHYLQ